MNDYSFRHLVNLSDDWGLLEHAKGPRPRFSHGYCTDDNARMVVVATRDPNGTRGASILARLGMRFVLSAQTPEGRIHNRLSFARIWLDEPTVEDSWGRSLWAFGTVIARSRDGLLHQRALGAFESGIRHRSESLRTMAFAALGAAEVLDVAPAHSGALELIADAADLILSSERSPEWPWPEPRLTYANAALPEVVIAAGLAHHDDSVVHDGLEMLRWLIETETYQDHFSVTPTNGRGPGDPKPAFDQQPIELAAIADAAHRALSATGDHDWIRIVDMAARWFHGDNDAGVPMIDDITGGGFDGLHAHGRNLNQGAESTLAMISTLQVHQKMAHLVR
ncbi:MAG: hypothetical protein RIS33_1194 [Actinomycetota bacterium]|jgi:hypothetical protein